MRRTFVLLLLASLLAIGVARAATGPTAPKGGVHATLPAEVDPAGRYLFYLHGKIIEDQGLPAISPEHGEYQYGKILERLASFGLTVVSEPRARGFDVTRYAEGVVTQIKALLAAGVPPEHITVVGASKGAYIASLVSHRARGPRLRFVLLGGCSAGTVTHMRKAGIDLHGDVLAIRDVADTALAGSCGGVLETSDGVGRQREIVVDVGTGHGILYRPLDAWVIPTVEWATSSDERRSRLRLYAFECGRLHYDSLELLGIADHETEVRDLVVPCYVIEHEKGRLLWEGGLPSSLAGVDGWKEMDGGWRMRLDKTLEEQLAGFHFTLADFDYMSFSHFHFDHVGVANELEGAKLIIQKREHEKAFAEVVDTPGFSYELYDEIGESEIVVIEGEHDVFGDGRVRLIPAPGHTLGHQVLYLDLEETGPVVLSGDLYVFRVGREHRRVLNIDAYPSQSMDSMRRIEAFLEETGAELWIGHDLNRFNQTRKPPEYHD